MMRRTLMLLSLLAALAVPAGAATRYVAQSARGTGTGADTTNCQSLSTFNSVAQPGDVAMLMGNFTTLPNPANSGTLAAPITYRSRSGNANDVCFTGAFTISGSACDSNVVWRDITIRGGVQIGLNHETARWQMYNVRIIDGGFTTYFTRDCRFENVRCTRIAPCTSGLVVMRYADSTTACRRDTLRNSSFAVLAADGTGSSAINIFSGYDNYYEAVRCSVTTTTNAGTALRCARVLNTVRGVMKDCYFFGNNLQAGGGNDEPMTFSFKDGVKLFKMVRDTIIIRGNNNAAAPFILFAQNETDGVAANVGEEIGGNSFRNCYIRNETLSTWPIAWIYGGFDGDSVVGNTFVARGGAIQSYYNRGDPVMATNTVVDHNLFVSFAHTPAFTMLAGTAQQAVKFTNNIFYNPVMTDADTASARVVNFGNAADWGSTSVGPVGNDYNIAYAPNVTTRRAVKWSAGNSALGMSPWLGTRSGLTLDANSRYAPVQFVDSSLASFDGHPVLGSAALSGPDGYIGPFVALGSGDVIPPGQVTSLAAGTPTGTAVPLTWLAPGDDGFTGTATAYDVRWSTSPITDLTFATCASAIGTPVPTAAGTPQSMQVTGLASGTTYWFALKARDEAGNWSALSTVVTAATVAVDTIPPAAVTDLH